ncbi:hypothetical protein [Hallella colorans]|uniref:hypothetical protein n=1 Tax=Hallella colorans TaxID=1703337 RepID=UPI0023EFA594|nr:hypothetical protein [Hallella colorans]
MKILLRIYDYDLPNIYYKPRKANGWAQAPKNRRGNGERMFGRAILNVRLLQPSRAPNCELKKYKF